VIGSVTSFGNLSLTQGAMTYAVSPSADAPATNDDARSTTQTSTQASDQAGTEVAQQLAASNITLSTASMSALIQAQANLSKNAPAMIRRHTAEALGQMIWNLDQAPPLSPAPMAVRQLQAVRSALLDIRA
jgi:hypothetical protein